MFFASSYTGNQSLQSTPRIPSRLCSSQTINSNAPSLNCSAPASLELQGKESMEQRALPMCICDVAEQTGHWKGITSSPSALLRHPGHPRLRHYLNLNHELRKTIAKKSRIIKRPLTGSNQLVFLVLFLVSFRLQNNFAVHL